MHASTPPFMALVSSPVVVLDHLLRRREAILSQQPCSVAALSPFNLHRGGPLCGFGEGRFWSKLAGLAVFPMWRSPAVPAVFFGLRHMCSAIVFGAGWPFFLCSTPWLAQRFSGGCPCRRSSGNRSVAPVNGGDHHGTRCRVWWTRATSGSFMLHTCSWSSSICTRVSWHGCNYFLRCQFVVP